MINTLIQWDCLIEMQEIPDKSIDMILCDLPYWTTACKWDTIIPFAPLWEQYKRIIKDNGAVVLFGAEPFSSHMRISNISWFKYDLIWSKSRALGFTNAKNKPMNKHEVISIFSGGTVANKSDRKMTYNPQGLVPHGKKVSGIKSCSADNKEGGHRFGRPGHLTEYIQEFTNYPTQIIEFKNEGKTTHPTQKPVALFEYLIKTYTNEWDTVLDNCAGSWTTWVACKNTNRNYILIEKDEWYCNIIRNRLSPTLNI
jgi:site-specific DNA-methyltransferase (adenine-specific)